MEAAKAQNWAVGPQEEKIPGGTGENHSASAWSTFEPSICHYHYT
jgi:hypothetical protein